MSQDHEDEENMMSQEDEERHRLVTKVVGDYKHGSIRRVKLQNFLTYSDVEFSPGPRLNMVIGPNGTGKSTILCAICLGLGGEPKVLGRASEIETYIKTGEDESLIEIELENTKERNRGNPIIRRYIRRDGSPKSNFTINNESISSKKIRSMVLEKYCISIENLCTFLPQDRVGSFSAFDAKALLIETEKSLSASQHLYITHQELILAEKELQSGTSNVETLQEKLGQLQMESSKVKRTLHLMEERELALKQADLLSKKLLWLKFDRARDECIQAKEERSDAKSQLKVKKKELVPIQQQHEQIQQQVNQYDTRLATLNKRIEQNKAEMQKQLQKYESHDDKIEDVVSDLQAMDSTRTKQEQTLQHCTEKVELIQKSISDYPSLDTMLNEHKEVKNERAQVLPNLDDSKRAVRQTTETLREGKDQAKQLQQKLDRLLDDKARRNERIYRQNTNLQKIVQWLNQNNNRSKFRRPISGPIVCEITTKSKDVASYLEHHVPNSTLKSFVVEDKNDYDILYKSVRNQLNLPISVILVPNGKLKPMNQRTYSESKLETLKSEHGVLGYLDELFTAPDPIMQALRSNAAVHTVLIGSTKTQDSLDNHNLLDYLLAPENVSTSAGPMKPPKSCMLYACEQVASTPSRRGSFNSNNNAEKRSFRYHCQISRYSKKASTRIDQTRPAKWLAPGVSDEMKQRVENDLREQISKNSEFEPKLKEAEESMNRYLQKAQELTANLKQIQESIDDYKKLNLKLRNAQRKRNDAQAALNVDLDQEKSTMVNELKNRIVYSISALQSHGNSHKAMMETTYKSAGVRLTKEHFAVEERRIREQAMELQNEYRHFEELLHDAQRRYTESRQLLQQLKETAEEEAPFTDDNGNELPLKSQLEELPVETLEEAEAALEEAHAKADSIAAVDPSVIRQYERQQNEIEEIQAELDHLTSSKESKINELHMKRQPWETALKNSVTKVDTLFSTYMSEMGFTGGVQLHTGDSMDNDITTGNFKDWGIEIKVSFRENTKKQVLSARVQSGGERSVSTILYLMALQELMVSPFRCVDEINQGLDDRNERLVFQRIVTNSTKPPGRHGPTDHSGQYFLITPKLLPNLYAMEEEAMTVLFIFNGPYNFKSPTEWDVQDFCNLRRKRRRQAINDDDEDDRENTPNLKNDCGSETNNSSSAKKESSSAVSLNSGRRNKRRISES